MLQSDKKLRILRIFFAIVIVFVGGLVAFAMWAVSDSPGVGSSMAGQQDDLTGYIPVTLIVTVIVAFAPMILAHFHKRKQ